MFFKTSKLFFVFFIFILQSINAQDDICGECENTWWDDYWGEQCCDVAWDQWGFDCQYMEDEYGWDCTGCNCFYDENSICGDGFCTGDENIDNCSLDCTNNGCNVANQVDDCCDNGCCPIEWYGDGYCDDGQFCDLRCYEYDGGDCSEYDGDDCPAQEGDINDDGLIDVLDVIIAVEAILSYNYDMAIDLNDDGIINIADIILFINIILNI